MNASKFLLRALVLCAVAVGPSYGQTTFASLTGTISDPSGMAVVGAKIEAIHARSNYRYTTESNEAGIYTFSQLREGDYELRVNAVGFKEYLAKGIGIASLDVRRIDVRLELGAVGTSVEVTAAGAALIETEIPRVGDTREAETLKFMPTGERNLTHFLPLSPGVLADTSGFRSMAGSRETQNDSTMDGVTLGNGESGGQIGPLTNYIESFQEVRIDIANNSAEFNTVGQITVVSKSGGNKLHGSLFDYYSSPWFRARKYYADHRAAGVRHNPGVSIGGPVFLPKVYDGHNKTFFFFSMETARGNITEDTLTPTVPLAAWRNGDFSGLAPRTTVVDPLANRTAFPENRIPAARINPVSRQIQEKFYPLPNFGDPNVLASKNYRETTVVPFNGNTYFTARLDHRLSSKSLVYGRYSWYRMVNTPYDNDLALIGRRWQQRDCRSFNLSYSYSLTPKLFNEFRWGFAYNDNPRHGPQMGKQLVQELGLVGLVDNLPDINGIFKVNFSGLGLTAITQQDWRVPGYKNFPMQFQEHLSWFRGRHSFKGGFNMSRVSYTDGQANSNLFGSATFSNRFTGYPYADFLLGIPTTVSRAYPHLIINRTRWASGFFFTDDFKFSRRLTLSLGVRYDYNLNWKETGGYQSEFDIASGKIVVPNGSLSKVSPLMPKGYVGVVEAGTLGLPGALLKTDRNNIAPRIGVAYRPWNNRTVFRAGYGIYYDGVPGDIVVGGVPYVINEPSYTNPTSAPDVIFPRVFPATIGGPSTVSIPRAFRSDLQLPYAMQYSFTVEHERWNTGLRASFIATNERQGIWTQDVNQRIPDTRPYIAKVNEARFPQFRSVNYRSNGLTHQYNSLTLGAKRRLSRGLYYQGNWVWARDIGYDSSPENSYNLKRERGVTAHIPTHRITGNFVYLLPFGRRARFFPGAGRWLDALIGGWHLTGIYAQFSGQFLTPDWSGPDPVGTSQTSSATPANVTIRPNALRDPNLPKSQRTADRYFDVQAFGPPTPGNYGTASRGCIKGPGSQTWSAGLYKQFQLVERAVLRLELTGTNMFNHPNWSNPGVNVTSLGSAGVISGMSGTSPSDPTGQRTMRMGVRLEW